jgi:hypothetical protein
MHLPYRYEKIRFATKAGLALFLLTLLLTPQFAMAQMVTASVQGTAVDPSGAAVPNASVTALETSTGVSTKTTTDGTGRFIFPQLAPGGPYTVTTSATGFKTDVHAGIMLDVNQSVTLPVSLQLGATDQKVEVFADASQVDTTSAAIGEVIENRSIEDLPLNQRNVYSLVFLAPGVTGSVSAQYNSLNISIDGGRPGATDVLLDAIPASPPLIVPIGGLAAFPSIDAVQEFKVMNNQYSTEFGRSQSGIINIILKSGTNQFHGSAYDFVRNSAMDANLFFNRLNKTPLPPFSRNQFGGSLSGPVRIPKLYNGKDKTFFLFSYEGLRQGTGSSQYFSVPTALERVGDFSQSYTTAGARVHIYDPATTVNTGGTYTRTEFSNGGVLDQISTSRLDPVASKILAYYPLPNVATPNNASVNNYFATATQHQTIDTYDSRVDEDINDRNRFFVRYSRRALVTNPFLYWPQPYQIAEGGQYQPQVSNSAAIDYTRTQSPKFLIDARFGFSRTAINFTPLSAGFNPSTQLGMPSYIATNADHLIFPGIAPASYQTLGDAGAGQTRRGGFDVYLLGVDNTKIIGHHVVHFGFDGRLMRADDVESGASTGNFSFSPVATQQSNTSSATSGSSIASLALGLDTTGTYTINSKNAATESKYYGLFVQDDWQILPKLSLNLGLRYDLDIPRTERYNRMEVFNSAISSPLSSRVTGLTGGLQYSGVGGADRRQFTPRYLDFGPRAGMSYALNNNTTIRAGYGIYYGPSLRSAGATIGQQGFSNTTSNSGLTSNLPSTFLANPFPNGLNHPVGSSQGLLTGIGTTFNTPLAGDNKVGYVQSWSLDIQRQLPGKILLDASYVGTHAIHLNKGGEGDFNLNQLTPAAIANGATLTATSPNPFFGSIATGPESGATIPNYYLAQPFPQFLALGLLYPVGGYEHYNAFQFKMEKHLSHGLTMLISFTDQKQVDDYSGIENVGNISGGIQNIYNDTAERAVSSNNIGKMLIVSAVYALPFGRGQEFGAHWNRGLDALFGGWQINGIATEQNGFPLAPSATNSLVSGNAGNNVLRPNVVSGVSPHVSGPNYVKRTNWVNLAAFSTPAPYTFGNAPRTLSNARSDGTHNIDASIFKNFKYGSRYDIEIRGEFFNVLNQTVFGAPTMNINSAAFGTVTSQSNSPRDIQAAAKFVF